MRKVPCPKCGADNFETDAQCLTCGVALGDKATAEVTRGRPAQQPGTPQPKTPAPRPLSADELRALRRRRAMWVRVAVAVPLLGAVLFVLSVHFVTSEDAGLRIVRKQYPTWRETVVSLDELTTIPYDQAKARFPLAIRALQREGILETDEEREARIAAEQAELERELAEQQAQAEREFSGRMDRAAQDMQDRMDDAAERVRDQMDQAMPR